MGRHLVLTVHGIGEQKPGETVDAIVGAATTRFPDVNRVPVVVERDLIQLAEQEFNGSERRAKLFPMHLRKVRPVDGDDETLFAEVYWADRSPAPVGPFRTIFDLLKVVLGLGYLAMDNVENNRGRFPIGVVHLFTWIFYGLVAPLNAMLAIGAGLLLADVTPLDIVASDIPAAERSWDKIPLIWVFFLHGALTLGVGVITAARANTYLVRIFGRGMTALGVVMLFLWEYGVFGGDFCDHLSCQTDVDNPFTNLNSFVRYSVTALGVSWASVVFLAMASYVTLLFQQDTVAARQDRRHRNIYPSICAAMIMFWMIISSAIWVGFVELVRSTADQNKETTTSQSEQPQDANENKGLELLNDYFAGPMNEAMGTLSVTFLGLILIVVVGLLLVAVRAFNKELLYKQHELGARVILNIGLQWAFFVALTMIAVFITYDLYHGRIIEGEEPVCVLAESTRSFDQAMTCLRAATPYVMTALLGLFVLIYNFSNFVAGGLGVVRDIVTYAVVKNCMWLNSVEERRPNFHERNAIDARFRRVLYYGVEALKPDRITVISHSQGTVVSTQMLQNKWVKKKIAKLQDVLPYRKHPMVLLVTMGSPVTHIYRRYFGQFFQVPIDNMPKGIVWHNIHRADDFVGTTIDDVEGLAGNWSVPAGGHTGYFTDFHVWDRLWNKVGFRLF
ncbi:hypothetical protein So717_06420 [Roseobacter cerasinus]|uniref:Uncharacterized protein n=1 Tax=Roseobacter cerasinus TaxID=2602289 RepID=A0A640VLD3_9RHOB|nr:hypothetical protein [Roseobacter cerasinus]GFE48889.1 hypothetical protein So717_06420 [Roseobacter cerasinus]